MPRAFPHQLAWLLNNPVRGLLLSPRTLLSRLPLRPTDRIVELGPGSGYFSLALSAAVPEGHLELVDLQPEMLAKARRRLTAEGRSNVGYTVADAGTPLPLGAASFDLALLVHVLGEVENQSQCLRSLAGVLKPGGVLALHEGVPDPDRIPIARLVSLVEGHGFSLDRVEGPPWNYTALFRRRGILDRMTFRLRAMTAADVPAVAALHVATFNETHTVHNDGPSFALREHQWSKAFTEDVDSWFGVVIEAEDGELVGFAKGMPHDGGIPAYAGELNKIYLLRRYHRQGLGKRLLCDVARRFLERGVSSMLLFGDARNPSNGFYEAMGGERIVGATPEEFHGAYGWRDLSNLVTRCGPPE